MLRIALFLGTNFAILLILSVSMSILGIEGVLDEQGVGLDLNSLLIMSSIVGFSGSIISLFISKWMAKKSMGVKIISTPKNDTEKWLLSINKELSQKANINVPEFGIFDSKQPNAFATGSSKNNSLVAVSTGLLVTMNKDEVEAVVAHEICHISNGDMVTMSLIQGIVNTFVIFFSRIIGHLVDRLVFKVQRGHGPAYFITSIIAQIVLSILASIIVMWFSRRREYKADSGAALLVGKEKMISALKVLGKQSTDPLPDQMAAFGISGNKKKISSLFSSHPSIEKRISALLNL